MLLTDIAGIDHRPFSMSCGGMLNRLVVSSCFCGARAQTHTHTVASLEVPRTHRHPLRRRPRLLRRRHPRRLRQHRRPRLLRYEKTERKRVGSRTCACHARVRVTLSRTYLCVCIDDTSMSLPCLCLHGASVHCVAEGVKHMNLLICARAHQRVVDVYPHISVCSRRRPRLLHRRRRSLRHRAGDCSGGSLEAALLLSLLPRLLHRRRPRLLRRRHPRRRHRRRLPRRLLLHRHPRLLRRRHPRRRHRRRLRRRLRQHRRPRLLRYEKTERKRVGSRTCACHAITHIFVRVY